jgi:hypothetical protein
MTRLHGAYLVCVAWLELVRYDVIASWTGFHGNASWLLRQEQRAGAAPRRGIDSAVADAVALAACLYWKRVQCLQRCVCMAALLRRRGVPARLVIGYRPVPFLSHAWVEVDGKVVNDSPVYQRRLQVLHTI